MNGTIGEELHEVEDEIDGDVNEGGSLTLHETKYFLHIIKPLIEIFYHAIIILKEVNLSTHIDECLKEVILHLKLLKLDHYLNEVLKEGCCALSKLCHLLN
jgi:hypothetical protein